MEGWESQWVIIIPAAILGLFVLYYYVKALFKVVFVIVLIAASIWYVASIPTHAENRLKVVEMSTGEKSHG